MKKIILHALLVFVLASCATGPEALVEEGVDLGLSGKYDEARVRFKEALEMAPSDSNIYYQLAILEYKTGNKAEAAEYARKAAELLETGGKASSRYMRVLQVLTAANAKMALPFWERYLLYLENRGSGRLSMLKPDTGEDRELEEVKKLIARIKTGRDPFEKEDEGPSDWVDIKVPPFKARTAIEALRRSLETGKAPSHRRYPEFLAEYNGGLFAIFFPKHKDKLVLKGYGSTLIEAMRMMMRNLPKDASGYASAPCVFSWTVKAKGPEKSAYLLNDFEPGLDGLAISGTAYRYAVLPEEGIWRGFAGQRNITVQAYVQKATDPLGGASPHKLPYVRFRTQSVLQESPGDETVELFRARKAEEVQLSAETLRQALEAAGNYLLRRQRENGQYEYLWLARYGKVSQKPADLPAEMGAAWAMAKLGKKLDNEKFRASASAYAEYLKTLLVKDDQHGFYYIEQPDKGGPLGLAAMAALFFFEASSEDKPYEEEIKGLADFLVHMQNDSGSFKTYYKYMGTSAVPPPPDISFPQQACWTLAKLASVSGDKRMKDAAVKGTRYLLKEKNDSRSPSYDRFDNWLILAAEELVASGVRDLDLSGIKRLAEGVMKIQISDGPRDCLGAIDRVSVPRGFISGAMAGAFSALYGINKTLGGDTEAYGETVKGLARFQLRTQVSGDCDYFLRNPEEARGGFRKSLVETEIRLDYMYFNIYGLLGALEVLEDQ